MIYKTLSRHLRYKFSTQTPKCQIEDQIHEMISQDIGAFAQDLKATQKACFSSTIGDRFQCCFAFSLQRKLDEDWRRSGRPERRGIGKID